MNSKQLKNLISKILYMIDMYSPEAVTLLMGTAAQESHLKYINQLNGPAMGLFQMEPATEKDIWDNYLVYKPKLATLIYHLTGHKSHGAWLEWDLAYQIIMCRLHYRRVNEALPAKDDLVAQAIYYKKYYNTYRGKATAQDYIKNYKYYAGS